VKFFDQIPMTRFDFGLEEQAEQRNLWGPPGEPGYSENDGFWMYDAGQGIGVHAWLGHSGNLFPEAYERFTAFLPGEQLLVRTTRGEQRSDAAPSGPHMTVRCEEPFHRWHYRYAGPAYPTTTEELRRSPPPSDRASVDVEFEAHARMLAPVFPQGAFFRDQGDYRSTSFFHYNGGLRYEQVLTADATLRIGDRWYRVSGPGMRTHRKGARSLASTNAVKVKKYEGHRWVHVIFPSGRALYYIFHGAQMPSEEPEAYVREGGVFYRAKPLNPLAMSLTGVGETASLKFEYAKGIAMIDCEIIADSYEMLLVERPRGLTQEFFGLQWDGGNPNALAMSQAFARYRWGDEVTINMMERSVGISSLSKP